MDEINIYNNSSIILERKVPKKIISWITILISFIIFILLFGSFFKYTKYEKTIGIVNEDNLIVFLEPSITIDNELIIENKKYDYTINSINKDYTILDNKKYYETILNIDLDSKYKINNNILEIYIELEQTTLMKEIINFFKKGMI